MPPPPAVQYVTTGDGVRIAYTVSGSGPTAVVLTDPSVSHVEMEWTQPVLRDIYGRLAQDLTLVRLDIRGTGLSERVTSVGPETIYGEVRAVVEHLGLKRYILGAVQIVTPAALIYASRYPDEVTHLVVIDGCLSVMQLFTSPQIAAVIAAGQADWTTGTEAIGAFTFGVGREESIAYGSYVRECIGPEFFPLAMQATHVHDATPAAKDVRAPTLVVKHAGNSIPMEVARNVAAAVPNASLVTTPGLWADEPVQLAERMLEWLSTTPAAAEQAIAAEVMPEGAANNSATPSADTAIIFFADIVDSTALTEQLGDARFRDRARELDQRLRVVIRDGGGEPIEGKLLGDGVLATFSAARDAIAAALRCAIVGDEGGLPLHLGLHAGDVIFEANNVFGGAVNIAARISALSSPGEVLASDVVRGLARTSTDVIFDDRGVHALKGIADRQRIFLVRPARLAPALEIEAPTAHPTIEVEQPWIAFGGGRYVVQRLLGEGGQKTVYLVHDTVLDRDCALALLRTAFSSPEEIKRMRREAQAMARLAAHQNIVTVHDLGEEDGRPYIVCEYVPGGDLQTLLHDSTTPLALARAISIATDVCRALAVAHARGIVHRDIKPANIWLNADGSTKLGDFGVASAAGLSRITMAGMVVGTAAYMSPEQAQGHEIDERSDLYALGCVLYELVTGRPPFVGPEPLAVVSQHVHAAPPSARRENMELPNSVDALITRLLAKDKRDRPETATAVAEELDRIATSLGR